MTNTMGIFRDFIALVLLQAIALHAKVTSEQKTQLFKEGECNVFMH